MQGLSFVQVQGPVSMSKNIGSSNPLSKGDGSKSFDHMLAGLLGSGNFSKSVGFSKTKEDIPQENLKIDFEKVGIYGALIESFFNLQIPESAVLDDGTINNDILEDVPELLNEDLYKEISQHLLNMEKNEELEEFNLIKDKIVNLFKDNKVLPDSFLEKLFSEENIEMKNFTFAEKEEFTLLLTKELLGILQDSSKEDVSQVIQKLDFLKDLVQRSANPLAEIQKISGTEPNPSFADKLEEILIPSEKTENIKEARAEVNSQKSPIDKDAKTSSESQLNKTDLSFQKSLDNNISKLIEEVEIQEKVEPRNLPKFIENQIKNSFKTGESGFREITIKINPEHLGKIILRVSSSEDSDMNVKILAESKNIKELLDTNLTTLRNNLESSGIKNGAFNIEIDFEKNFNQSKGSNPNFSGNSNGGERKELKNDQSFEERIQSIFNNMGGLEVLA